MTFQYYLDVLRKYAEFNGRARRSEYWYFVLFNTLIGWALSGIGYLFINDFQFGSFNVLSSLYSLAILLPSVAVAVRRLHDAGKSGWYYLLIFLVIIGWIWLLILFTTDSQHGENEWGPNPKGIGNDEDDESQISLIGQ